MRTAETAIAFLLGVLSVPISIATLQAAIDLLDRWGEAMTPEERKQLIEEIAQEIEALQPHQRIIRLWAENVVKLIEWRLAGNTKAEGERLQAAKLEAQRKVQEKKGSHGVVK